MKTFVVSVPIYKEWFSMLQRHMVDALGVQTSYYEAGQRNGRPVVLLHGMSASADSFRELMQALRDQYWLLAPDIPGFGHSHNTDPYTMPHLVEWLAGFRQALDLPPMACVGHSFGGVLAISYALDYPEDVERMLLAAPSLLHHEQYPAAAKKASIALGLVDLGSKLSQSSVWVKRQIKVPFHNPDAQPESVWLRRLQDYAMARASADVLKALAFHDLRPHLPDVEQPVALIWGENDTVVPPSDAEKLAGMLPRAEVHKLLACGHVSMLEQRDQFAAVARQFLE